ncbi:MAG TPA: peptidyl-alpha-hydroxyglycine alpha-amidating lyase family protein [Gammaproteobacteria bacterium]|nr:peptidyl-alpha-hydroxyglycine alpha-amidating lyase family protein [Gammaproteobacteria bacterium]
MTRISRAYSSPIAPIIPIASIVCVMLSLGAFPRVSDAQALPNPYRLVDDWARFPDGREIGAVGDTIVENDGSDIWAVIRCDAGPERFGWECLESDLDPVVRFDAQGNAVASFGGGMFIWPHGIDVDPQGNVWVTDAAADERIPDGDTRGHQVIKFSPSGEVLMVLGTPGEAGSGPNHFNAPADVVVADNGDIFVADGHGDATNNRVVKFASDGTYITSWGRTGYAPGEFRTLHAIAIDLQGRVFVGDRSNNRIQIFDQDGTHLASWTQFGRPSGVSFDAHGRIYVADSESDDVQNPGWEMGIRIGDAATGWVEEIILYQWGDPRSTAGNGAEFVAVDSAGNLYGGEPRPRRLQKYVRVRP